MIPSALKDTAQWILWKQEVRDGKATKVPCDTAGRPASVNDPRSWLSYDEASFQYEEEVRRAEGGAMFSGIGFCFTADDPFFGVDLDDCYPALAGQAREILSRFRTYAEVSPSGQGVKLIGRGTKPPGSKNRTSEVLGFKQMEVYDRDRFFTVTGEPFGLTTDVEDCQEALDWLCDLFLAPAEDERERGEARGTVEGASSLLERAAGFEGTDEELIFLLETHTRYGDLWRGDTSEYGDDESRADAALAEAIAWYCGPVPDRIERIFDASALADRKKWARADYRRRTIEFALSGKTDFYNGPGAGTPALDAADYPTANETGEEDVKTDPLHDGSVAATPRVTRPRSTVSSSAASFPIPDSGIIRDVVDLVGPMTESPDETLALGTLVMLSAVAGWNRVIEWGESDEPAIMYACICGPSARGRKTTGMRSVESIFREVFEPDELRMESGGHVSGRGLIETAIGGIEVFHVKEPKITAERYIEGAEGENPEWVQQGEDYASWVKNRDDKLEFPPAVVLVWDEFGKMLSVEGDWQRDTRSELLSMYGGRHRGIKTSGKDGVKVPAGKTQMALLATMTSDDLRRGLNVSQATDGLMGRIIFSPDGRDKPALSRPPDRPDDYDMRKQAIARKIIAFRDRCHTKRSVFADWSKEAKARWDEWYNHRYETMVGLEALLFGRVQSTAAKIACLLAMAENVDVVELRHVEVAVSMAETSIQVSVDAVNSAVEAQRDRYTDGVLEYVVAAGPQPLSRILERGMLGGKEPGERTIERELRVLWIEKDGRLLSEKGESGKGHKVSAA